MFIVLLVFVVQVFSQSANPRPPRTTWKKELDYIQNGTMTFTYKTLTSPTITSPAFSGTASTNFDGSASTSAAAGDRALQWYMVQSDTLTGTAVTYYGRTTGGDSSGAGTLRGAEIGARVTDTGSMAAAVVTGGYFWADAKARTATTLRGLEVSLDGSAGGTSTLASGIVIFNNSSATQTSSYAVDVNEGNPSGRKAFTADLRLQNGELIDNATNNQIALTAGVFKQAYDAAAYWTATQADGGAVTFNSVSDGTAGFTFSDLITASAGITSSNATLTPTTGRLLYASGSMANATLADGYGIVELDGTITGTSAGHVAMMSSWINIPSGTASAGNYVTPMNIGIYEDAAATITNAKIVFGARMHKILGDTDGLSFPFSLNTNNAGITALFDVNTNTDLGIITNAGSDEGTLVPLSRDVNGNIIYVKIYTAI